MTRYTSIAAFMLFAIALIVPSGFSVGAVMLVLGSVALIKYRTSFSLDKKDWTLIGVFALYFAIHALLNIAHAASGREYDAPLRFLFAAIALFVLLHYPPRPCAVWAGLAVGGISAGVYAISQITLRGMTRAEGTTNPIQYGNISMLLGILCIAGIGWAWQQPQRRRWLIALAAGALLGIIGSLLTGSRGSWLGLPVSLIIVVANFRRQIPGRYLSFGVAACALIVCALFLMPQTGLQQRLKIVDTELASYTNVHDTSTSIGTRLEMWRSATLLIPVHPILGWGKEGYLAQTRLLVSEGKIGATPAEHTHLHNDYIDATVKRGIIGLIAVLLLYCAPFVLFYRQLRNNRQATSPFALAGILLYTNYILFGLTQAFLTHNNGVMILGFTCVLLWACCRQTSTTDSRTH